VTLVHAQLDDLDIRIGVHVADPALAAAIEAALAAAIAIPPPPPCEVAIVRVSRDNARGLVDRVDELRAAGAVAIQLVWDGRDRGRLERHVFAALERGRASPAAAPVVLADTDEPVAALLMLIELRNAGGVAARAGNPALAVANRRSP
jgi:hypothetical protein